MTLCWARPAVPHTAPLSPRTASHLHRYWHTQSRVDLAWTIQHHAPPARVIELVVARPSRDTHTSTRTRFEYHRVTHFESHVTRDQLRNHSTSRREIVHLTRLTQPPQSVQRAPTRVILAQPATSRLRAPEAPRASVSAPTKHAPVANSSAASRVASPAPAARAAGLMQARHVVPPPALVWPRPAPVAAPFAPGVAETEMRAPIPPTTTTAAREVREPPGIPLARQVQAAVRANVMDAAVIDRLADDVLKRVEKKLRIERERRGL